jgi:hypothetical protein
MAKKKTIYEWVIEEIDESGDIEDCNYYDRLEDVEFPTKYNFGLCKRILEFDGYDYDDEIDKTYGYIVDGKLPSHFDDGSRIPQIYHIQLEQFLVKN